jgi:transposase
MKPVMLKFSKYVELDVHKQTIAVAVADGNNGELRFFGEIGNTTEAIKKLVTQLGKAGAALSFCYEAGPGGYNIHRLLRQLGFNCQAVAPSLIPKKVGDRIKTDRRDALALARQRWRIN